jgi:hypothetical protein
MNFNAKELRDAINKRVPFNDDHRIELLERVEERHNETKKSSGQVHIEQEAHGESSLRDSYNISTKSKSWFPKLMTVLLILGFSSVLYTAYQSSLLDFGAMNESEETFESFFHAAMAEMHADEPEFSYSLVHQELDVLHKGDGIAVFLEQNSRGEQIFIAYLKRESGKWKWKYTRGAEWGDPVNWALINEVNLYSGAISDSSIKEVYVGSEKATIVILEDGRRFWYAINEIDEAEVRVITHDGTKIPLNKIDHNLLREVEGDGFAYSDYFKSVDKLNNRGNGTFYEPLTINRMIIAMPDAMKDGIHSFDKDRLPFVVTEESAFLNTATNEEGNVLNEIQLSYHNKSSNGFSNEFYNISVTNLAENPLEKYDFKQEETDTFGNELRAEELTDSVPIFHLVRTNNKAHVYTYYIYNDAESRVGVAVTGANELYTYYNGYLYHVGYMIDEKTEEAYEEILQLTRNFILGN